MKHVKKLPESYSSPRQQRDFDMIVLVLQVST